MEKVNQYGEATKNAIYDVLDKYKYSGEENLSPQVFRLPNMHAKKEAVQKSFSGGLSGFITFVRDKIYSKVEDE